MKILITPRSFASFSDKPLKMLKERGYEIKRNNTGRPYKKKEMLKLIRDVDGIIIGIDELSAEIIEETNELKVISKYGIGLDNIDINMATNILKIDIIDCIVSEDRLIFIVKRGYVGIAIGSKGKNLEKLRTLFKKNIKFVELDNNLEIFIKNLFL